MINGLQSKRHPITKIGADFFCDGAPQERTVQSIYSNCTPTKCLQDATTGTVAIGSVEGENNKLYCNQILNCSKKIFKTTTATAHPSPSIT